MNLVVPAELKCVSR